MRLKVKETHEQEQLSTLMLQHTKDMCTNTHRMCPQSPAPHIQREIIPPAHSQST